MGYHNRDTMGWGHIGMGTQWAGDTLGDGDIMGWVGAHRRGPIVSKSLEAFVGGIVGGQKTSRGPGLCCCTLWTWQEAEDRLPQRCQQTRASALLVSDSPAGSAGSILTGLRLWLCGTVLQEVLIPSSLVLGYGCVGQSCRKCWFQRHWS